MVHHQVIVVFLAAMLAVAPPARAQDTGLVTGDTGSAAEDTGMVATTPTPPAGPDTGSPATFCDDCVNASQLAGDPGGAPDCSCATSVGSGGVWALLLLLPWVRRRR